MKIESSRLVGKEGKQEGKAKELMESQRYLLYSVLFALFLIFFIWLTTGVHLFKDSQDYIAALSYLKTGNYEILEQQSVTLTLGISRLLRPLLVLSALPFSYLVDLRSCFGIVNAIFLVASAVVMHLYTRYLLESEKLAFYSTLLFLTSFPVVCYGLGVAGEIGVYFFILLTIYLTIRFFERRGGQKDAAVAVIGFICGLGVLMKENVAVGMIFFLLMLFSSRAGLRRIASLFCILLPSFLLPLLFNQALLWHYFDFTYYDWFVNAIHHTYEYHLFPVCVAGAFGFSLLFGTFGLVWFARKNLGVDEGRRRLLILGYIFLASSVIILLWPFVSPRFIFLYSPIVMPMAGYAIGHLESKIRNKTVKYLCLPLCLLICVISTCLSYYIYVITHNYPPFQLI